MLCLLDLLSLVTKWMWCWWFSSFEVIGPDGMVLVEFDRSYPLMICLLDQSILPQIQISLRLVLRLAFAVVLIEWMHWMYTKLMLHLRNLICYPSQ